MKPLPHDFMAQLTQQAIYLMGVCFILGSLFTIFILLILDMVRRNRFVTTVPEEAEEAEPGQPHEQ